jgi:hypothetical protein
MPRFFTEHALSGRRRVQHNNSDHLYAAEGLRGHLIWFALPVASRRYADAASFLRDAGNAAAAAVPSQKVALLSDAQYLEIRD